MVQVYMSYTIGVQFVISYKYHNFEKRDRFYFRPSSFVRAEMPFSENIFSLAKN